MVYGVTKTKLQNARASEQTFIENNTRCEQWNRIGSHRFLSEPGVTLVWQELGAERQKVSARGRRI